MPAEGSDWPVHWLQSHDQRLALCPALGGSVAAWHWQRADAALAVWRGPAALAASAGTPALPAETRVEDMACFPMLPWCNRIAHGGFAHDGRFHPLPSLVAGEPCAIHGDGWRQAWTLERHSLSQASLRLHSAGHAGHPHHYLAWQGFRLLPNGLLQTLRLQNLGAAALPFGLGLHPWWRTTPQCTLRAPVQALWLSAADHLPTQRTGHFPAGWDLNAGVQPSQVVVDNVYGEWSGQAHLVWPEHDLGLQLKASLVRAGQPHPLYLVLYAPPGGEVFCLEPQSHPINAPHLPGRPGWLPLAPGQTLSLVLRWQLGRASDAQL